MTLKELWPDALLINNGHLRLDDWIAVGDSGGAWQLIGAAGQQQEYKWETLHDLHLLYASWCSHCLCHISAAPP